MSSGSPSTVILPTSQHQFLLLARQGLVSSTFFLRLIAFLGATYPPVPRKRLTRSRSPRPRSRKSGLCSYFSTFMHPRLAIQYSTSHGLCSKTRQLRKSRCPTNSYTCMTSSMSVLWPIAAFKMAFFCQSMRSLAKINYRALWLIRCHKLI